MGTKRASNRFPFVSVVKHCTERLSKVWLIQYEPCKAQFHGHAATFYILEVISLSGVISRFWALKIMIQNIPGFREWPLKNLGRNFSKCPSFTHWSHNQKYHKKAVSERRPISRRTFWPRFYLVVKLCESSYQQLNSKKYYDVLRKRANPNKKTFVIDFSNNRIHYNIPKWRQSLQK